MSNSYLSVRLLSCGVENMTEGILGKKFGMSQVFMEKGRVVPVTVVQAGPCVIVQKKTTEKDGYSAAQLGFDQCPERLANKPRTGHIKKAGAKPVRLIMEMKGEFPDVGSEITLDIFKEGEHVDITGISKGKGFSGGMKKWNWSGGPASHGSMSHRRIGSVGAGTSPGRIFKGKTLPGRMGNERVTVQNLKIVKIDVQKNLLMIKGAVPGIKNGYLKIRKSVKREKS